VAALAATDEEALHEIDVGAFGKVIVAIGKQFECNLMTTVALKRLGVRNVICKALTEREQQVLQRVDADRVVLSVSKAGLRLAQELIAPNLLNRLALAGDHSITELRVPQSLIGMTLYQADLRHRFGLTVLAVERGTALTVSPSVDHVMRREDRLVVLGTNPQIVNLSCLP
jgi:trk system potassium uptake protein TrkA